MKKITKTIHSLGLMLLFIGSLMSQNMVYTETFGACEWPQGWENNIAEGGAGFITATSIKSDPDYGDNCHLYFLDNPRQGKGDTSNITVTSPWINPLNLAEFFIDYKVNFIKVNGDPQVLEIYYETPSELVLFEKYDSSIWGATFNDLVDRTIRIDNSKQEQVRLVIKYQNFGDQNAVVTIDNIVFRGYDNKVCESSIVVDLGRTICYEGNNLGLYDSNLLPSCEGIQTTRPNWFQYVAQETGYLRVTCSSEYNEVLDVYYGRCDDLIPFRCTNADEYGFVGEDLYLRAVIGNIYYIRVSGYDEPYSTNRGAFCISFEKVAGEPAQESYDICSGALDITRSDSCVEATNVRAKMEGPIPSLNTKSKADIWFKYTHDSDQSVDILTNADFADVITLYTGSCLFLNESFGTDQGPNYDNVPLIEGTTYFIQVSGYFASLEGDLCMEIKESKVDPPTNDNCDIAQALNVNQQNCIDASTEFATTTGIKGNCYVKAGPDIWYTFTPDNNGTYELEVNADFRHNLTVFQGECDSLIEAFCSINPHRCEGYVSLANLEAGIEYFIQISAENASIGVIRGDVCVAVYEEGRAPDFNVLNIDTEIECIGGDLGILNISVSGGEGNLSWTGSKDGSLIKNGQAYQVIIDDESDCRVIAEGFGTCNEKIDCSNSNLELIVQTTCELDKFGLETGRVSVDITHTGGVGQIEVLGHPNGQMADIGALIQVAARDESGCLKYFEMVNDCEPWTCEQSDLTVSASLNCIDSLFRAELIVTSVDGNGAYQYSGTMPGALLENGDMYTTYVTDETGCIDSISGIVNCDFDSCVYSGLALSVDFECITDNSGKQTGQAILRLNTEGGVGQFTILGGKDGDTLNHRDIFQITIRDEWGCESFQEGVVNCAPTSTSGSISQGIQVLYPNPTHDWTIMSFNSLVSGEAVVQLINTRGQVVHIQNNSINRGNNKIPVIFGSISSGIYTLQVVHKDNQYSQQLVITP